MAYPSSIDAPDTTMQGLSFVAVNDHAADHRLLGSAVISLETKLGIGSGSAAVNQLLVGSGAGTATWGTVWNGGVLGSPSVTGGTIAGQVQNNGTVANGVYGTATYQGGTANNLSLGSPTITSMPWTNYTPVVTGVSGTTSVTAGQYLQIGNLMMVQVVVQGTSNATTFTFSVPVPGIFSPIDTYYGICRAGDSGAGLGSPATYAYSSGTTVNLYKDFSNTGWTNSGVKTAYVTMQYRV